MDTKAITAAGCAAFLAALLTWILIPPFPPPLELLEVSLPSITSTLGQPAADSAPETKLPGESDKTISWQKSRGIAVWILQASYSGEVDATLRPHSVSRCLHTHVEWLNFLLPCEFVTRAQIQVTGAPNQRVKFARVARTTGKSLRASPAFYTQR